MKCNICSHRKKYSKARAGNAGHKDTNFNSRNQDEKGRERSTARHPLSEKTATRCSRRVSITYSVHNACSCQNLLEIGWMIHCENLYLYCNLKSCICIVLYCSHDSGLSGVIEKHQLQICFHWISSKLKLRFLSACMYYFIFNKNDVYLFVSILLSSIKDEMVGYSTAFVLSGNWSLSCIAVSISQKSGKLHCKLFLFELYICY